MKQQFLLLFIIIQISFFISMTCNGYTQDFTYEKGQKNVIVATDEDFDKIVEAYRYVFVYVYAPWCSACERLTPIYGDIADKAKKDQYDIVFVKIDATENQKTASKVNINGYPTMRYFVNGEMFEYKFTGVDHPKEINECLDKKFKKNGKHYEQLESKEDYEQFGHNSKFGLVYSGSNQKTTDTLFKDLCLIFDGLTCRTYHSPNPNEESLTFYSRAEPIHINLLSTELKFKDHVLMLIQKGNKEVSDCSADLANYLYWHKLPYVVGFLDSSKHKNPLKALHLMGQHIDSYHKSILVCKVENIKDRDNGEKLSKLIGVTKAMIPSIYIIDRESQSIDGIRRYRFTFDKNEDENVLFEQLKKYIGQYRGKELNQTPKSEDVIPLKSSKQKVVQIVGLNFDYIVSDPAKDVLVMFYKENDQKLDQLKKAYEELADDLADSKFFVVCKLNAEYNEEAHKHIKDAQTPVIKFFGQKFKNRPVTYTGELSYEELVQFVKSKSTIATKHLQKTKTEL